MAEYLPQKHQTVVQAFKARQNGLKPEEREDWSIFLKDATEFCQPLAKTLPNETGIIHADPKLSNIIFQNAEAAGFVDNYSFQISPYVWDL